jgi:hypothetical protein
VLVFTNQQNDGAIESIGGQILDGYLGVAHRDWVAIAKGVMDERGSSASAVESAAAKVAANAGPPTLPLDAYVGTIAASMPMPMCVSSKHSASRSPA